VTSNAYEVSCRVRVEGGDPAAVAASPRGRRSRPCRDVRPRNHGSPAPARRAHDPARWAGLGVSAAVLPAVPGAGEP